MNIELLENIPVYVGIFVVIGSIVSSFLPIFIILFALRAIKRKNNFSVKLNNGNNIFSNTPTSGSNNASNRFASSQATKIGNGIDFSPVMKIVRWIVGFIILIILLGILYYILVKYLGMSVNIE